MNKTDKQLIKTTHLAIGMFVSDLDRPWLELPFAFRGFTINHQSDIDLLQRNCEYVYIDPEEGNSPPQSDEKPVPSGNKPTTLDAATHHQAHSCKPPSTLEHKKAVAAYTSVETVYKQVNSEIARDAGLNLNSVAKAVTPMITSLRSNPDAMLQLVMLNDRYASTASDAITTSVLAAAIGIRIGIKEKSLYTLAVGGLLYDVGKHTLPQELLNEPRMFTPAEFKVAKSHVEAGVKILADAEGSNPVLIGMAQHHHERYGGSGYPAGLEKEQIPLFARIAAIVDCFNAITSQRPHRQVMSPYHAALKLYEWRNTDFDPKLVEELIQVIGVYPLGSPVELTNGKFAVVVAHNGSQRLRPIVATMLDENRQPLPRPQILNLSAVSQDEHGNPVAIKKALLNEQYDLPKSGLIDLLYKNSGA